MKLRSSFQAAQRTFDGVLAQQAKRDHLMNSSAPTRNVFGNPVTPSRTDVTGTSVTETRRAQPLHRREAIKTNRFIRAKLGLGKALYETSSRYALGAKGLVGTSACGNRDWSDRADDYAASVLDEPELDVRGEQNFAGLQALVLPDMMCDGECFAAKVRGEDDEPQVQLFSTEAVGNAAGPRSGEVLPNGARWEEGILRSEAGRKLRYRTLKRFRRGQKGPRYEDFDASVFMHIGRFDRISTNRPMPWLHHGDESALDILDLTALEKASAKVNSYFAAVIKTMSGKVPEGFEFDLSTEHDSVPTEKLDPETGLPLVGDKPVTRNYANLFDGAAIPVLGNGEELQFLRNDRPSQTFQGFIDWLINDIAVGFGVPPQFVWALSGMSGPVARLVMQQADWFFRYLQEIMITRFCRPVWRGVIEDGMDRGLLELPPPGVPWRKVDFQGPASMTIDKGRDGKLFEALVKAGLLSRSEWHEMMGRNGRAQRRKIIEEISEDIQYCTDKGVPLELYFGVDPTAEFPDATNAQGQVEPEVLAETIVDLLSERRLEMAA